MSKARSSSLEDICKIRLIIRRKSVCSRNKKYGLEGTTLQGDSIRKDETRSFWTWYGWEKSVIFNEGGNPTGVFSSYLAYRNTLWIIFCRLY